MEERYDLAKMRIAEIEKETCLTEPYCSYFKQVASFLVKLLECFENLPGIQDVDTLKAYNHSLYQEILPGQYEGSFANPACAVRILSEGYGQLLSALYAELYCLVPIVFEGTKKKEEAMSELVIRMELFLEIYCCFSQNEEIPSVEELREIFYWFVSDYLPEAWKRRTRQKLDPACDFAYRIIMESDLSTPEYLFSYGEYISYNQIETAKYMATLDEKTVQLMADTYTEGYRIGFVKGNKDLSKKKIVNIVYPIGFERMIKLAIANFEQMGLKPSIMRTTHSIFYKRGIGVNGYYSDSPNRQFDYDHKEDEALFLDKRLVNRKLEAVREAYEQFKELAAVHAGPAWVEVFGEETFVPDAKKEAVTFQEKQQGLVTAYNVKCSQTINEYIPGTERSFTIIAFPVPEIGDEYEAIMKETIALNTLNYHTYEKIQQMMIDTLDKGRYVTVKGMGENKTDLKIMLCPLDCPEKQTIFENCVADVNIPVGEVFTSPVLKGTEGVLHVTGVYLSGLFYQDLTICFKDGRITEYSCSNFKEKEENEKYIKDNILFHHESLPMGEFAIGTNTTAYVMAEKYQIKQKLPILIGEKTGPHFAVGDTCYSHCEEVAVFNPDGKEIIARENEVSLLRKTDEGQAYFGCHTDITLPYDELGELSVVTWDEQVIPIIRQGRFVLPGTEELNAPFCQM